MTSKPERPKYQSELRAEQFAATRQRIIEAAVKGFAPWASDIPFDKVAERARVSERTVYRHFPTQRDLFEAVITHIIARSGWNPDEVEAETLGATVAQAFTYYGTLFPGVDPAPEAQGMQELRSKRLKMIERIMAPYIEGMDPVRARGLSAVIDGLVRVPFLRGMHEHWGLSGHDAGRAVEWAINTLLDQLRQEGISKPMRKSKKRSES
jgi:AcrR family transcriptional regulator